MGVRWRKTSQFWYSEVQVNGRRQVFRLPVAIRGVRPSALGEPGNAEFESSRAEAREAAEKLEREQKAVGASAAYYRQMADLIDEQVTRPRVKKGAAPRVALADLFEAWQADGKERRRSALYMERVRAVCRQFAAFAAGKDVRRLDRVSPELAAAYLESLTVRRAPVRKPRTKAEAVAAAARPLAAPTGVATGTWNAHLVTLRSVFARVGPAVGMERNPWAGVALRQDAPIHRRPLSDEETTALIAACDPIVRGPVVTGICTALRRADACRLRWDAVDLDAGFVLVKTEKTGAMAEIPIFPMLRTELERALAEQEEGDGAGALAEGREEDGRLASRPYCWPDAARMIGENPYGISYRVRRAFEAAGIERSAERAGPGLQRKSPVADFHALRTTWITKALAAGVPMEIVRRVTGHSTVQVVLRHYFRPGRDEFRKALAGMMKPETRAKDGKRVKSGK